MVYRDGDETRGLGIEKKKRKEIRCGGEQAEGQKPKKKKKTNPQLRNHLLVKREKRCQGGDDVVKEKEGVEFIFRKPRRNGNEAHNYRVPGARTFALMTQRLLPLYHSHGRGHGQSFLERRPGWV